MGISQLLSVPYALYAETSGDGGGNRADDSWTTAGNYTYLNPVGDSVGIGTDTPDEKLHVIGKVKVTDMPLMV